MKDKLFVIGDIHGQITQFNALLKKWNESEEQLILVGDLGDRGENPKACFELARELVEKKGAVCLRGNHEEMLLNFMNDPIKSAANYDMNGGGVTIQSFLDMKDGAHDAVELSAALQAKESWLKPFLESLPFMFEWEKYVIVHAGVNLNIDNWRDSSERDFVWIREGFYDIPNPTNKTFVFGHTVTAMLHGNNSNTDIWKSGDGKIGIDGGAVYGGTLHGVVFDRNGIVNEYKIPNEGFAFSDLLRKG